MPSECGWIISLDLPSIVEEENAVSGNQSGSRDGMTDVLYYLILKLNDSNQNYY